MDAAAGPEDEDRLSDLQSCIPRASASRSRAEATRSAASPFQGHLDRRLYNPYGGTVGGGGQHGRCGNGGGGNDAVVDGAAAGPPCRGGRVGQADVAARGVVAWASWRLLGWMMAAVASLVLFG